MFLKGFWGQYGGTIDEKGRLMLPQKLRDQVDGVKLILTKGVEKCLTLYRYDQFEEMVESMMSSTTFNQVDRDDILRRIVAPAMEIQTDKTGRIKLSSTLMRQMGLLKNCTIIGMNTRIEIWDEDYFEKMEESRQGEVKTSIDELRKKDGVIL